MRAYSVNIKYIHLKSYIGWSIIISPYVTFKAIMKYERKSMILVVSCKFK